MENKSVQDSLTEQSHLLRFEDINGAGRLFGGKLISWIDEVASTTAKRHCCSQVTTASIDNLQFKHAAHLDDLVVVIGHVTHVGKTSMEIRVDSYVEDISGMRRPINRAYVTNVAIDDNGNPLPVPFGLTLETEAEKMEWESAVKRVELRRQRRKEGF